MSTLQSPHTTDTTHADTADAESTGAAAPLPDGVEHGASVQPTILEVVAWTDPIDDAAGHDPRSDYVERFWLGLLGPSTTWLLRRFARGLDECPTGFRVNLAETGRALGLGESLARNSTTRRSIDRACQFGLAYPISLHRLAVRRTFPSL
ncbi:MAG TPA: hypothetical protein PKD07_00680, partial [Microthrixaceae bacterium]|nr:hypothetical protein [Microthrixaceae bacterium]